ncbi:MAG: hypothetical protein ACRDZX_08165 [Acidimicrobiales bacterium]
MRFGRTEVFKADYKRLSKTEQALFRKAVREFNAACDAFVATRDLSAWPAHLRVKAVADAPGIFELTWSFSGPDARATWEWVSVVDKGGHERPAVRWRRLGTHRIFQEP